MHVYCLFCETQKCGSIAHIIQNRYGVRCISPRIIQRKWVKGQCLEEYHDWLPGYVFLYSEEPLIPIYQISGIIRWLENSELTDRDYQFAEALYQRDGVMGIARLAEVGDRCELDDPVWKDLQGTVIKMDRSRKRCCVEFEFAKTKRTVWVGYELVKRYEEPKNNPAPSETEPETGTDGSKESP